MRFWRNILIIVNIITCVITCILCFVLVFSENVSGNRDKANIIEKDYKVIEELRETLHSLDVSEAEEHLPHVEQHEGAGDGDDAGG